MDQTTVSITKSAAEKIKNLLTEEESNMKMRLSISGGGCSGFQYGFDFDSEYGDDDISIIDGDVFNTHRVQSKRIQQMSHREFREPNNVASVSPDFYKQGAEAEPQKYPRTTLEFEPVGEIGYGSGKQDQKSGQNMAKPKLARPGGVLKDKFLKKKPKGKMVQIKVNDSGTHRSKGQTGDRKADT